MSETARLDGLRRCCKIGWENYYAAQKMNLRSWPHDKLGDRYTELCNSVPDKPANHPHRPGEPRWDEPYLSWLSKHGSEVKAISDEITRRWRGMK